VAVSFASIFIRLAEAPSLVIAAYRMVIASFVLLPIASVKSFVGLKRLRRSDWLLIFLSGVFLAWHFGLWITSLSYTTIASSVVLVTSHPVFVAIMSYFLWGERLTKLKAVGIMLTLAGTVLISYGGFALSQRALIGDLLALLAGFAVSGYLLIGRQLRAKIDILGYLTLCYTSAAVLLLISTLIAGFSFFGYSGRTYLMLILVALVPQLIGHSSLNLALRFLPAIFVSVAIVGEPVGATLLGYFILKEVPTVKEIAGGLLILSGIFAVLIRVPDTRA